MKNVIKIKGKFDPFSSREQLDIISLVTLDEK